MTMQSIVAIGFAGIIHKFSCTFDFILPLFLDPRWGNFFQRQSGAVLSIFQRPQGIFPVPDVLFLVADDSFY